MEINTLGNKSVEIVLQELNTLLLKYQKKNNEEYIVCKDKLINLIDFIKVIDASNSLKYDEKLDNAIGILLEKLTIYKAWDSIDLDLFYIKEILDLTKKKLVPSIRFKEDKYFESYILSLGVKESIIVLKEKINSNKKGVFTSNEDKEKLNIEELKNTILDKYLYQRGEILEKVDITKLDNYSQSNIDRLFDINMQVKEDIDSYSGSDFNIKISPLLKEKSLELDKSISSSDEVERLLANSSILFDRIKQINSLTKEELVALYKELN